MKAETAPNEEGFPTKEKAAETIVNLKGEKKWQKIAILMAYYTIPLKDSDIQLNRDERKVVHNEMDKIKLLSPEKLKNRYLGIVEAQQQPDKPKEQSDVPQVSEDTNQSSTATPKPAGKGTKKRKSVAADNPAIT